MDRRVEENDPEEGSLTAAADSLIRLALAEDMPAGDITTDKALTIAESLR